MKKYFKKTIKKGILLLFIISEIFLLSVPAALGAFSIPSFDSVANEGEDRYNVDGDAVRDMAQSMNVGGLKSTVPELMLIFSPQNPNPGEEMSAQALPMYFSNDAKSLYFTWYLRHNSEGGDDDKGNIDWNHDGEVDIEDYKIEAMRILAQGGWEPDLDKDGDGIDDYDSVNDWYDAQADDDDDNDGYKAISGGDNKKGMKNYCYLHDYTGGKNYEFTKSAGGATPDITCDNGFTPVCANSYAPTEMKPIQEFPVCADDNKREGDNDRKNLFCEAGAAYASCHGDKVTAVCYKENGEDEEAGIFSEEILRHGDEELEPPEIGPIIVTESCSSFPKPRCSSTPKQNKGGECDVNGNRQHLFARAPGYETGDESFGKNEERFWGTNPHDSSTAGKGYNDEAVISGLGQDIFKWAYQEGDLVGVVIEGTSILITKHDDSSNMIMWAFVNNHCSAKDFPNKGQTQITAGTYPVMIDTVEGDINKKCLKNHTEGDHLEAFMDPVGGASENLDLKLSYMPEFSINDPTGDHMGDVASFQVIINNSNKPENELLYNWEVDICSNGTFNCSGGSWKDIADYLTKKELLKGGVKGNGLAELKFELGINPEDRYDPDDSNSSIIGDNVFKNDIGYIRVKVKVRETFSSGMSRQGNATATMKVVSTDKKLKVYKVGNNKPNGDPNDIGSPNLQLIDSYAGDADPLTPICSSNSEANAVGLIESGVIESNVVCRVMKNEIIGIKVPDDGDDLSNFNWVLDGKPLVCNEGMSKGSCKDDYSTNINFFPVTKSVGESYTLTVTATENIDLSQSDSNKPTAGKKVTLVKRFEVIEPYVKIIPDNAGTLAKDLGNYIDLEGTLYLDKSESIFQVAAGGEAALKAELHPTWINMAKLASGEEAKEWIVDGLTKEKQSECAATGATDCAPFEIVDCADGKSKNCIVFIANKKEGEAYNISFAAAYNKDLGVRRALLDLWDVIQQESGDGQFANSIMVEVVPDPNAAVSQSAPKRFLASLSSNLSGQVIFLLRIILTGFIIIFVSGMVFSLSSRQEGELK